MAGAMTAWIAETWERRAGVTSGDSVPQTASAGAHSGFFERVAAAVTPLMVACSVLAVSPDFDVFFHTHRTYTHSLGAAIIVWLVVALAAWRLRLPVVKVATVCAAAYASHVLLDWLGRDDGPSGGLMVLWPLTTDYYRSGLNLFLEISGRPGAVIHDPAMAPVRILVENARAIAREALILGPPFLLVMKLRLAHSGTREPVLDQPVPVLQRSADERA